jgi:hypothetical protein
MKSEPVISPFLWRRRPLELDVKAMQQSENMRAGSARGIETRRGRTRLLAQSKAGQLRAALANGPMTCAELVRATKIPSSHIYPTLRPSLQNGHVVMQHCDNGIVRYALAKGVS